MGLRPNGFQDRLVMTTSIPLRIRLSNFRFAKRKPRSLSKTQAPSSRRAPFFNHAPSFYHKFVGLSRGNFEKGSVCKTNALPYSFHPSQRKRTPTGALFAQAKVTGYSPAAKIRSLAAASQAGVALRGECEPKHLLCKCSAVFIPPQPTQKADESPPFVLAGVAGFGPTNARVKVWCLTAWLHPITLLIISYLQTPVKVFFTFLNLRQAIFFSEPLTFGKNYCII